MIRECEFWSCDKPYFVRGCCTGHYRQLRKGEVLKPLLQQYTLEDRFWEKAKKSSGCWEWTGQLAPHGYGVGTYKRKTYHAHRVSYEIHHGPIPSGMHVDHICWNKSCVNPDHLRLATRSENGQNRPGAQVNSKSGVRGVYWVASRNCWTAEANVGGKKYSLGRFFDLDHAARAVSEFRRIHMPYSEADSLDKQNGAVKP